MSPTTTLSRVSPIIPTTRPLPFNNRGWLFEPNDGCRGMLDLTRKGCTLYSKRGNVMTRFRGLAEQLQAEHSFYQSSRKVQAARFFVVVPVGDSFTHD